MEKFIESIRFENGKFHLLDLHQERVDRTFAAFFSGQNPHQLGEILPKFSEKGKHKFRFEYDSNNHKLESEAYHPKPVRTIQIVEADLDYSFKFADRAELENLLNESKADEIIIVKNGLVTDSSYSNLAFFDGSDWWTPDQPLLVGVRRASLLDKGKLKTASIGPEDFSKFEKVSLINAMLDIGDLTFPIDRISH